jgi:hypothetical protein
LSIFPLLVEPELGPFVANTSFPVLLVGNTAGLFLNPNTASILAKSCRITFLADPVTPLWACVASRLNSEFLT